MPVTKGGGYTPANSSSSSRTTKKSCNNCPQLLRIVEQNTALGNNFGNNICPLKMLMIGRPEAEVNNKHPEVQAGKCDSYGTPQKAFNETAKHAPFAIQIGIPLPLVPVNHAGEDATVTTCASCANYVPPQIMNKETGIKTGYCSAKGTALLDDRLGTYARGCTSKVKAVRKMSPFDPSTYRGLQIHLMPELKPDFGKPNPLAMFFSNTGHDPLTRATDKPVGPSAKALGVRGWLRVEDPKKYGPAIFLPMFGRTKVNAKGDEEEIFTADEIAAIPQTGDDSHPELYVDHASLVYRVGVMWTRLAETPALWGRAGVGKTELFRHMAWLMGLPFTRISITGSTEIDHLAGKMMYSPNKGTYFQYGRVSHFWQRPNVMCLDEANTGAPDVWQFIRPLTDDSKQMVLDQNEGERISRHLACYLGMAMNPAWDPLNIGAMPLADADGNRLLHVFMDYPPPEVEKAIIRKRLELIKVTGPEAEDMIHLVMKIAPEIRELCNDGTIPVSWGVRNQIKAASLMRYLPPIEAYKMAITAALEPSASDAILDVVRRFAPED